jgi:hypothetical protein
MLFTKQVHSDNYIYQNIQTSRLLIILYSTNKLDSQILQSEPFNKQIIANTTFTATYTATKTPSTHQQCLDPRSTGSATYAVK